ncbi:hypothetical protein BN7_5149 [Wickerhamomyces ciferrii]|uniref:Uncharacterized protein n=1 Tax=Wickerhamomyces ciferrii (strain ATCC 14091 / BCRC 22168 / CBS 111 / JCM 3599 / NBRC 0793 / NRRL Y-1031 F-60-10) TaxID=1206466 RepID=K0KU72_WICCF|nr:uncharacterized protein BN7_5149 [Wickerhamomyces ciferrii]CCH45567.1 hypothetical protein BN7_5149 [Wickerhamomyces ciferrii]
MCVFRSFEVRWFVREDGLGPGARTYLKGLKENMVKIITMANGSRTLKWEMNWKDEVLDLLKGEPLELGISGLKQDQIRIIGDEVTLDHLLAHTSERASLAVLMSRLKGMDPEEQEKVLKKVLKLLQVPRLEWIWWIDEYTVTKVQYREQLEFKEHSKNLLVVLKELVQVTDQLIENNKSEVIRTLGQYYIETPWCDKSCVAISRSILSKLSVNDDLIQELVMIIKEKFSRLKNNKVSKAGHKKLNINQGLKPKLGFMESEDHRQIWKTEDIDSISIFAMILDQLEGSNLKNNWWIITPTILNILDDHEGPIKLKGVELLSILLDKIDNQYFQMTGLIDIFYDAIFPLLSYLPKLTPVKQSKLILSTTYPVLIKMFLKTENSNDRLIKLLNSGIYQGINTLRDNFEILPILITQIISILENLGKTSVRCLPRLLYTLGMILSDPFIHLNQEMFVKTLDCLITTILNGWPRIHKHKYDLLGMIILSYRKEDKSNEVTEKITILVQLLRNVIDENELEADIKELVKYDPSLDQLFNGN